MSPPRAALSVDLEFFSHTPAYRGADGEAEATAVGRNELRWLRRRFADADARATFFTVSSIAERFPEDIAALASEGHEVASHTHTHRHLSELSPRDRRRELEQSKTVLEEVTGAAVSGFRAPSFDRADDHFAALDRTGYEYDSSLVPARRIPGWYGGEHNIHNPVAATAVDPAAPDGLAEVPVSVMPAVRLPLTGTWLRFFGVSYTLTGMRWLSRRGITPVLYVHPWELADLPRVDGVPRRVYVRTGEYVRQAVERILREPFEFVTVAEIADEVVDGREREGRT